MAEPAQETSKPGPAKVLRSIIRTGAESGNRIRETTATTLKALLGKGAKEPDGQSAGDEGEPETLMGVIRQMRKDKRVEKAAAPSRQPPRASAAPSPEPAAPEPELVRNMEPDELRTAFFAPGAQAAAFRTYAFETASLDAARGALEAAIAQQRIATAAFMDVTADGESFDGAFDYALAFPATLRMRLIHLQHVDRVGLGEDETASLRREADALKRMLAARETQLFDTARRAVEKARETLADRARRVDSETLIDATAMADTIAAVNAGRFGTDLPVATRLGFSADMRAISPFTLLLGNAGDGRFGRLKAGLSR